MESFGESTLAALMDADILNIDKFSYKNTSHAKKSSRENSIMTISKKEFSISSQVKNLEEYFNDTLDLMSKSNTASSTRKDAFSTSMSTNIALKEFNSDSNISKNKIAKRLESQLLNNSSESSLFSSSPNSSLDKTSAFDQQIDLNDSHISILSQSAEKKLLDPHIESKVDDFNSSFNVDEVDKVVGQNNFLEGLDEIEWNTENISFSQINVADLKSEKNMLGNLSNNSFAHKDALLINKIKSSFTESEDLFKDSELVVHDSKQFISHNVQKKHDITSTSAKSEEKEDDFETAPSNNTSSSSSKFSFHTSENKTTNITSLNPKLLKLVSNSIQSSPSSNNNSSTFETVVPQNCSIAIKDKTLSENDKLFLRNWGLPPAILSEYTNRGITQLFPWQVDCLEDQKTLDGGNLVYSAPTSAGKTLVSEILMIKTVLERHKKVLVILPFVSVVREKMFYFQDILASSGVRVSGFMGSHSPPGGFQATHIAVCTIEKANSLINRVLSENTLGDIGAIILDELHLIGDSGRGYILELLLTKVKYMLFKDNSIKIQLIGMSATLPNLPLLATWLNARLYKTDFRPIPLEEQCKVDNVIYNNENKIIRLFIPYKNFPQDPDNIIQLCTETISESCSVLIFCPTKIWCENLSQQISHAFKQLMDRKDHPIGAILRENLNMKAIEEFSEQLKNCPVGLDSVLKKTINFACAFHHAGLTMDERDIIEGGFRNGSIRVLVATSTLSSGVNLPARRVIIRSAIFHGKPLDSLVYRQMIGRAGRMGKDTKGESFLICTKKDAETARRLISTHLQPVYSCLEGEGKLKRAILEIIASGMASSPEDIELFTRSTLLSVTNFDGDMSQIESPVQNTVKFLIEFELIRLQSTDEGPKYIATPLGKACLSSSLPPEDGLMLFTELQRARQCFVLETELHMIYLVTPYSVSSQLGNIDWLLVLELWEQLSPAMTRVGDLVGVQESFLVRAVRGTLNLNTPKMMHKMQIHRRFYTALALQELVNEVPLTTVAEKFKCSRGVLQSLQQSAATFAGMVTSFSHQLGWDSVEILISQFQHRLQFGVQRDLIDLMRLPLLNGNRARAIHKAGIESLLQLATADVCVLENALHNSIPFQSEQIREDDCQFDAEERNKLKSIWVTGKTGLTPREAANLLILDARKFLEIEMGLSNVNWSKRNIEEDINISEVSSTENSEIVHNNNDRESSRNENTATKSENEVDVQKTTPTIIENLSENDTKMRSKDDSVGVPKGPEQNISDSTSNSSLISSLNLSDNLSKKEKFRNAIKIDIADTSSAINRDLSKADISKRQYNLRSSPDKPAIKMDANLKNSSAFKDSFLLDSKILQDLDIMEDFNIKLNTKETKITPPKLKPISNPEFHVKTPMRVTRNMKRKSESPDECEVKKPRDMDEIIMCSEDEGASTPKSLREVSRTHKSSKRLTRDKTSTSKAGETSSRRFLKIISKVELVDVTKKFEHFLTFINVMKGKNDISISAVCEKIADVKLVIGKRIIEHTVKPHNNVKYNCMIKDFYIKGLYIYCGDTKLYFMSLQNDSDEKINLQRRLDVLKTIFSENNKCIRTYDCKNLFKLLYKGCQIEIKSKFQDPKIADWLLHSKEATYTIAQLLKVYCANLIPALESLEVKVMSPIESIATWYLLEELCKRLKTNTRLYHAFTSTEIPSAVCLAKMEINGMGLNCRALQKLNCRVEEKMQKIQNDAYSLAGRRFNMSSSKEVAKVLGIYTGKRVSTNKQVLETIDSPISNLIMLWRKLNNTLTNFIYPLLRNVTGYNRLHGYFIMQTLTGRISMAEPNIQNVPKDFKVDDEFEYLSCRSIFHARDGYCIVSADYCQLELRILSHLSKDSLLCDILRTKKDVFKSIAAQWNNKSEDEIDDTLRQHTKQIIYGMIYGMGAKALAHTMNVTELEAASFMELFNKTYPGLKRYTKSVIEECSKTGYVETLYGRRRYLPNINQQSASLKGQAERQAVNTTVQGSAADISKMAMLLVNSSVSQKLPKCSQIYDAADQENADDTICFVLHMHDELIYEVGNTHATAFAKILKESMETVVKLHVPLPVKVKIGDSWGTVKEVIL